MKHENQVAHDFVTTGAQRMLEDDIRSYSEVSAWRDFRSYDKSDNLGKKKSDWTGLAGREHPERGEQTF